MFGNLIMQIGSQLASEKIDVLFMEFQSCRRDKYVTTIKK